jgi:hypothetical protein
MLLRAGSRLPCAPAGLHDATEAEACPPRRSGAGVGQRGPLITAGAF